MRTHIEDLVKSDILNVKNDANNKAKFLKDYIISPLNLKITSSKKTFENHDHQIHKRHLVNIKEETL